MPNVVRALINAHVSPTVQLHEGDLWIASDPIVKAHPEWFSDDLEAIANRTTPPEVVTATANPGERRANTRTRSA
jgi:hypothetical protein